MGYLSKFEQQLCSSLKKFEILGKRVRLLLLIITRKNEKAISYLMKYRSELVNEDNKYVFAVLNGDSLNQLRGNDAIRKHVSQLKEPSSFTRLEKHIVILCQLINLEEKDLELLATVMGLDITVHREYYRIP